MRDNKYDFILIDLFLVVILSIATYLLLFKIDVFHLITILTLLQYRFSYNVHLITI